MKTGNKLLWLDPDGKAHHVEMTDRICIGRVCLGIEESKAIRIHNPEVSRDHAVVHCSGSGMKISDLSKNGTWVNNVRMTAGSVQQLHHGDIIRIGNQQIEVICPDIESDNMVDEWTSEATTITAAEITVTNLVADLRGFSRYVEREKSASVYKVMREVFDRFTDIVIHYRGTVKDLAGDAVFAYWAHPEKPVPEQALLALRAAYDQGMVLNRIQKENNAVNFLRMGWGISTGSVTMSHYGAKSADMALVGDCTNMAFRLSDMANKTFSHEIVICSKTADLIKTSVSLHNLGLTAIKGRAGKEKLYGIHQPVDEGTPRTWD